MILRNRAFASWLGLCLGAQITGGKLMSGLGLALCKARGPGAASGGSGFALKPVGAGRLRPLNVRAHGHKPKAVTAAAHKLARLIYTMLTKGEEYTDQGQAQTSVGVAVMGAPGPGRAAASAHNKRFR
ncbi:MAG: hypothetical protein DDT26_01402 [Dehalococcoidia bacterium]|nr:hypothetical protein [Chloroflexota bacterium]